VCLDGLWYYIIGRTGGSGVAVVEYEGKCYFGWVFKVTSSPSLLRRAILQVEGA